MSGRPLNEAVACIHKCITQAFQNMESLTSIPPHRPAVSPEIHESESWEAGAAASLATPDDHYITRSACWVMPRSSGEYAKPFYQVELARWMSAAKCRNERVEEAAGVPLGTLFKRRAMLADRERPWLGQMFEIAVRLDDIEWLTSSLKRHGIHEGARQVFRRAAARTPSDAVLRLREPSAHEEAISYLSQFRDRVWLCLHRLDDRNIGWWPDRLRNAFTKHAYQIVDELQKNYDQPLPYPDWFRPLLLREGADALNLSATELSERIRAGLADRAEQTGEGSPKVNRVVCDPTDRSIRLDGKEIATSIPQDVFEFVRVVVEAYPDPIPFKRITLKAIGLKGKNQTRLRETADKCVKLGRKPLVVSSPTGYHIDLTPPK